MKEPLRIDRLVWDDWNREHLTKHGVSPEEVEEVVAGEPLVRETYKQRLLLIGSNLSGRMLTVILGPVPGQPHAYYPFSARPASRRERRLYTHEQGGNAS